MNPTIKRPSTYQPCPCGSGKKYKFCHRKDEKTPRGYIEIGPGLYAHDVQVAASTLRREEVPVPQWVLVQARRAAHLAAAPEAGHYEAFQTILMTAIACEAIVNRLLEPLVPVKEWESIERKQPVEKWERLSDMLSLDPPLRRGQEPLQSLAKTIRLRNDLMHFKHRKNIREFRGTEIEAEWSGGGFHVDVPQVLSQPVQQTSKENVIDALDPALAGGHLDPLLKILNAVLDHYSEDEFRIVMSLREAISKDVS